MSFDLLVNQLKFKPAQMPVVQPTEFEQFKKKFTFDALAGGKKYGMALCEHFNILDNLIMFDHDTSRINNYFVKQYVQA